MGATICGYTELNRNVEVGVSTEKQVGQGGGWVGGVRVGSGGSCTLCPRKSVNFTQVE